MVVTSYKTLTSWYQIFHSYMLILAISIEYILVDIADK